MKRETKNEIVILLGALLTSLPFIISPLFPLFHQLSLIILLSLCVLLFIINLGSIINEKRSFVIFLISIVLLAIGSIINDTGVGSYVVIMVFYMMLLIGKHICLRPRARISIDLIFLVFLFVFALIDKAHLNTNTVAYISFLFYIFAFDYANCFRRPFLAFAYRVSLSVFALNLIAQADSRAVLAAIIVFFILNIMPRKITASSIFRKGLVFLMIFGGLIFAYIYVSLWLGGVSIELPGDKSFYSGRQLIWLEATEGFTAQPLFGIGSKYELASSDSFNLHNSMLNILIVYGAINYLLLAYILNIRLKTWFLQLRNVRYMPNALYALICLFMISFFETNLVWADVSFFLILLFSYIGILSNNDLPDENTANHRITARR